MSLFSLITEQIISAAKRRPYYHLVHRDESPYMNRYWLMPRFMLVQKWSPRYGMYFDRRWKWLPALRVHQIVSSDWDRHLHCHPAATLSWILRNGYTEVMPRDQAQDPLLDQTRGGLVFVPRRAGNIVLRRATDRHRLIVYPGLECWSLFALWANSKPWGFHTEDGFVLHTDYWSVHQ